MPQQHEPTTGLHTILIVDDDPCLLGLLRLHLQNAGYCVQVAEDAVVAGRMLLSHAPDLIIVDVNMPYMDGLEFVQAVKSEEKLSRIPVIFLTINADAKQRALALGAVAFLTKPVLADQLLTAVQKQIPNSRFTIG